MSADSAVGCSEENDHEKQFEKCEARNFKLVERGEFRSQQAELSRTLAARELLNRSNCVIPGAFEACPKRRRWVCGNMDSRLRGNDGVLFGMKGYPQEG